MSDCLWPHGLQPTRLLHPWDFPGKSTGVGCHCLLRTISIHNYNLKYSIDLLVVMTYQFFFLFWKFWSQFITFKPIHLTFHECKIWSYPQGFLVICSQIHAALILLWFGSTVLVPSLNHYPFLNWIHLVSLSLNSIGFSREFPYCRSV